MQIKKISYSESLTVPNPAVKYQSNKYTVSAEAELNEKDDFVNCMGNLKAHVKDEIKKVSMK